MTRSWQPRSSFGGEQEQLVEEALAGGHNSTVDDAGAPTVTRIALSAIDTTIGAPRVANVEL